MSLFKTAGNKTLAWGRKKTLGTPRCQGVTSQGKGCPFYQVLSDEGYWTGACHKPVCQAQVRQASES